MVLGELEKLAAEFDAAVEADDDGFRYRFPGVRESFVEAELMRRRLRLGDRKLGRIVYATADSGAEASKRDRDEFDRELARAEADVSRHLPSAGRVGYEEDFEVVMEEARVRAPRRRRPPARRSPPRW
jgi:hypothetical protein